jgi:3-oxoacyl-(acyl-carrier-protein) synthase
LGHSLAAAGGDQMISSLGSWRNNLIPSIASTPKLAGQRLYRECKFFIGEFKFEDKDFDLLF